MHQRSVQQAATQVPQVKRPDQPGGTAIHELAEDGIHPVTHATEPGAPAWT